MKSVHFNFTRIFKVIAIVVFLVGLLIVSYNKSLAIAGINRQINFQGKLVNSDGTNVANGAYTIKFSLYNHPELGDPTAGYLWQETQTVTVVDGIFRVSLGSVTPIPSSFNFNWDGLYLGIKVNSDNEMTPRIQVAAVPFAFNAERVAGLTVQDESGNASTSGILKIPNAKTISFADLNNITFNTTADTTITLPTSGTLITNTVEANQTITSTQTSGNLFSLVDSAGPSAALTGLTVGLTGAGNGQNKTGISFDLSGGTGGSYYDLLGSGSTWSITRAGVLTVQSCTGCGVGGGGSNWVLTAEDGTLHPGNTTLDLLLGGSATSSALVKLGGLTNSNSFFNTGGNVGIGTTNPLEVLSVSGNATLSGTLALSTIKSPTGPLNLQYKNGLNSWENALTILDNSGNVGIGTTEPGNYKLNVNGNSNITGTLTTAQAITAPTSSNTINGLVINSGALSSITTLGMNNILTNSYAGTNALNLTGDTSGITFAGTGVNQIITGGTNHLALMPGGNVGVGTTAPTEKLGVLGNATISGTVTATTIKAPTGSLTFQYKSGADTWTDAMKILDNSGAVQIGTDTDGLTFNPSSGPDYNGTARPLKTITLSPEYSGAVLTADGSATTNGSMTADNTLNAGGVGWKNYYEWTSTQGTLQDYTIAVRVTLPADFDGWQTGSCPSSTCALDVAYKTGVSGTTDNTVSVLVNNAESTPATVICTISAASSTTWTSFGCTSTNLATSPTWNTAGATAIIRIKLAANSTTDALARVGDITLRYYAKF